MHTCRAGSFCTARRQGPVQTSARHPCLLTGVSAKRSARAMASPHDPSSAFLESYSLWVAPHGATRKRLEAEIEQLAARFNAPRFEPHVTLLPEVRAPLETVVAKAQELASKLHKYQISFADVSYGSIFYQCVYILCAKSPETMLAAAAARKAFDKESLPPYMPHLSLLYSDMEAATRQAVAAEEVARLWGDKAGYETLLPDPGFEATTISVWYTPTEDISLASWRKVAEFELQ